MAIHDAYARLTPYELLMPDPEFPDRCFPAVGEEAGERGVDPGNPAAFVMLGAVQGALTEFKTDDVEPEAAHDHGSVLYFAYHMWRTGGDVALVRTATLRELLATASPDPSPAVDDDWTAALHEGTGYVQLPQHLVWIDPLPDDPDPAHAPPESVDGFFWCGDRGGALHLALITGMRPDRPGYGVVPVPPVPLTSLPGWATGPAREGGGDFATSLPGADLDGLLGIRTPAEVFKLAALVLPRIADADPSESASGAAPASAPPGAGQLLEPGADQPPEPAPRPHDPAPRPSALPYTAL
ncbi:MAG: hypothetical protein OXE96_13115 [Gemmatimonadetes bacterium]|nr:hypothetical protein [Gemmatimonadota bacterium]